MTQLSDDILSSVTKAPSLISGNNGGVLFMNKQVSRGQEAMKSAQAQLFGDTEIHAKWDPFHDC